MGNATKVIASTNHAQFQAACHDKYFDEPAEHAGESNRRIANAVRKTLFRALGDGHEPDAPRGTIDGASVRRALIFRYDAVGDYVVSTMLIRWLRSALPHVEIDVLSSQRNASLVAADPLIDWSFPLHDRNTLTHPSLRRMLRSGRDRDYDLLFALPTNRMTRCATLARILAPEAEKISLLHRPRRHIYGQVFHRQMDRPTGREHWGETFLRMATSHITPVNDPGTVRPYLVLDHSAWRETEAFMRREGLGFDGLGENVIPGRGWEGALPACFDGDRYCVVNISAHCAERQWDPAHCAGVCRALIQRQPGLRLYIAGAPADAAAIRRVVQSVDHPDCRAVSMKLTSFIGFICGASMVITPDTATLHIAAAAGRPVVGLYAEEIKAAEWYPYATRFTLLVSPTEISINLIEPEKVIQATCELLDEAEVMLR